MFHWSFDGQEFGPAGPGNQVPIGSYEDWRIGPDATDTVHRTLRRSATGHSRRRGSDARHTIFGSLRDWRCTDSFSRRGSADGIQREMIRGNIPVGTLLGCFGCSCSAATLAKSPPRVNGPRIVSHLGSLSEFGRNPQGGVSRLAYSEADRAGREYVMGLMKNAGLEVSIDTAGNLVGTLAGSDAALKAHRHRLAHRLGPRGRQLRR